MVGKNSLFARVTDELTEAMRARDAVRRNALRNIRAAFLTEAKRDGSEELGDEACTQILRRLEKQRGESIEAFAAAGRDEQAAAERAELAIIQELLPQLADEAQTRAWVAEAVAATGAESPRDTGRVMGALMKAHKGEIDGNLAKRLVAETLAESS